MLEYLFYEYWLQGEYSIAPNATLENKHYESENIKDLYQKMDKEDGIIEKRSLIYFEDGIYNCNQRIRHEY